MDRRTLYVDVDDTLLMHDLSESGQNHRVVVEHNSRIFLGFPNKNNINMLKKFYGLGYEIIVWSKTGKTYAQAVVTELNLDMYVSVCLTKPDFYLDDKEASDWIGPRIYRHFNE